MYLQKKIHLKDGLIIDREDESGWLIEAFIDQDYYEYFNTLKQIKEQKL